MKHEIDEVTLTAYALGELDEAERREIEAKLADDAAAQRDVESLRLFVSTLSDALSNEELAPSAISTPHRTLTSNRWVRHFTSLAACLIVASSVAVALWYHESHAKKGVIPAFSSISASAEKSNEPISSAPQMAAVERKLQIEQSTHATLTAPQASFSTQAKALESQPANPNGIDLYATGVVNSNTTDATVLGELEARRESILSGRKSGGQSLFGGVWSETPFQGIQRDDIYGWAGGGQIDGVAAPADANNSVLLPTDDQDNDGTDSGKHFNTESYDRIVDNPFLAVVQNPLSTFSIDVDTASYANLRRHLNQNQLPPPDTVRIEEMLNYFTYDYAPPKGEEPFASHVEVAACPWNAEHRLVRVGLKGKEIHQDERPASNLVFLIDVSGSMRPGNKLPLLKSAMKLLIEQLGAKDRVAMVVYAGSSGMVLPSTPATQKQKILTALDQLAAGGSTNGAQGIELAYSTALDNFIKDGVNRVILCTDGDFNVGVTNEGDLTRLIEDKAKSGIFLSVLGFGMGNLKDSTMEKLADKGNGNYAYIDTINEARKVLVEQMSGTLVTIAKDVKIQIEFNPAVVGAYRLIGYENRLLAKEDFNDDTKDAGEIGAGHAVTAMYEVVPAGKEIDLPGVDPLKYQKPAVMDAQRVAGQLDLLTLKLRYKAPDEETSKLIEVTVKDQGADFEGSSHDFKFASAVAGFGMILRDSPHKGSADFKSVLQWAERSKGEDASGYRAELIWLVQKAEALKQ